MTPRTASILAWIGGGVLGAALSKQHRIAGAALGAVTVGVIADKVIEQRHPWYKILPPPWHGRRDIPPIWSPP